jgi:TolB-like protein
MTAPENTVLYSVVRTGNLTLEGREVELRHSYVVWADSMVKDLEDRFPVGDAVRRVIASGLTEEDAEARRLALDVMES